jgi:hypothetical protein
VDNKPTDKTRDLVKQYDVTLIDESEKVISFAIRKNIYFKIGGIRKDINFNFDTDPCFRTKKEGKSVFLLNNPVVSSNKYYRSIERIKYLFKVVTNYLVLMVSRKTIFYHILSYCLQAILSFFTIISKI